MLLRHALIAAALIAAPGCEIFFGGEGDPALDDGIAVCEPREPTALVPGTSYQFVIDSVDIPSSATEAFDFGLNLDRDPEGQRDNELGYLFSALTGALGSDYDAKVAELIADGTILHLVETNLPDGSVGAGARVFLGNDTDDDPSDNFDGGERFDIEPGHPTRPMTGTAMGTRIDVEVGVFPLRIGMPGVDEAFDVEVTAGRLVADVTGDGFDGVLAGGLTQQQIDDELIPFLHRAFENSIALDCPGGECEPGSQGDLYLDLFDRDNDGMITIEEVRESALISSLFEPDLDVFDEDRRFNPRCDGEIDLLSLGVHVTGVPATFDAPAW